MINNKRFARTDLTHEKALEEGFTVDTHTNPPVAYKGPRFDPEEIHNVKPDKTNREVELEILLELARDNLGYAIDCLKIIDGHNAHGSLEVQAKLLNVKARIIRGLEAGR